MKEQVKWQTTLQQVTQLCSALAFGISAIHGFLDLQVHYIFIYAHDLYETTV